MEHHFGAKKEQVLGEFKECLDKVDFGVLRKICAEIGARCGLDPEKMNFIGEDRIKNGGLFGYGSYSAEENILKMNLPEIKAGLQKYFPEIDFDVLFAYTLCHEESHALSKRECRFEQHRGPRPLVKMGYSIDIDRPLTEHEKQLGYYGAEENMFDAFNEGVTDIIAQEVFREYVERTGIFTDEQIKKLSKFHKTVYSFQRHLADSFAAKLARIAGFSKKTVWESVKHGFFSGTDDFYKSELRDWLDTELGADYMKNSSEGKVVFRGKPKRSFTEQKLRGLKASILKLSRKVKK